MKTGFIGLGLIGGSIAKAIRQYFPESEIVAFDKSRETLALATAESVINTAVTVIDENFKGCDYLFLCTPVIYNSAYLSQIKPFLSEKTILTDVGSVKTPIHQEVEKLGLSDFFIGGHPMAGSEKSGYVNSKAVLIENAYYILSPSRPEQKEKIQAFTEFIQAIRAIPVTLDCRTHDYITGTISHLPHVIASGLVNFVRDHDTTDELMKLLAAGGFKDITRIASSSPTMWEHVLMTNRENVSEILGNYIKTLEDAKKLIDAGDSQGIYNFFDTSRNYRNSVPDISAGPIKKLFAIYCDIIDEAGGIATIATILASNNISIKNIGIIHNREFEEGVLRIEFYEGSAQEKAAQVLRRHRYTVYERS